MKPLLILLLLAFFILAAWALWQRHRRMMLERERLIRAVRIPPAALQSLEKAYPHLSLRDVQLVARALRQFFLVHARAGRGVVVMPSKAVDALWHGFILDTRAYGQFCQQAFGGFFHHIPESGMQARDDRGAATWRTWRLACLEENINPAKATRLPLLFAIDVKLGIPGAVAHDPASFKPPEGDLAGGDGCGGGSDGDGGGDGCGGGCGGGE